MRSLIAPQEQSLSRTSCPNVPAAAQLPHPQYPTALMRSWTPTPTALALYLFLGLLRSSIGSIPSFSAILSTDLRVRFLSPRSTPPM